MKRKICIILLLVLSGAKLYAQSDKAFLRAIRTVETGDCEKPARGALGERGAYQFRHSVWRQHTSRPFHLAEVRHEADAVALIHLEWIRSYLLNNGVPATYHNVAMAWNAGVGNVKRGSIPYQSRDYAQRVLNLMEK